MRDTRRRVPLRTGRLRAALTTLLLLTGLTGGATAQSYHPALDDRHFPLPESLVPNVEFWRAVFSQYSSSQTVIHDNRHLDVVFAVVDVSDLAGQSAVAVERASRDRVRHEITKYQNVLRRLAGDQRAEASPDDVERVRQLYAQSARQATDYRAAVERVRGQGGLRDRFREAIETSGMFMPGIERILLEHDVPVEIRCLPFVESMFNYRARSSAGASGVWQFTAATGRRYLQMNAAVDARNDVWLAAEAAARMLKEHFGRVQSWPLALTGYNHGIAGMQRAQRQLGTSDMGVIADRYQSATFGFASRNFYAEFVAAVIVYADRARHFPGVWPRPALQFDEFVPDRFVSLLDLAALSRVEVATLLDLNPALSDGAAEGVLLLPPAYPLRVPEGTRAQFEAAYLQLPSERRRERQLTQTYRVQRGDTLGAIASRFGTSVSALQRANGIARANRLQIGQVLEVGTGGSGWTPLVWTPAAAQASTPSGESAQVHVVRSGETLYQIATRYGLTVAAVVAANDIVAPDRIMVGTSLAIPER